jgi:general secretion pathway protein A
MYESFYRLSHRPFQLSPDPRFFFASRGHKRAMSYLRYGLNQGEGFIIITGDIGTGKTTLVRSLFAELSSENIVAAQMVTTQLEADDTLRMVAASFGLAHEAVSKATLLKNLEAFLVARAREGRRVLLVVDEAQNLPSRSLEELRMLSNFQVGERPLLQSFLLGQEEFRKTLQSEGLEQLRQRVIAAYHLTPLDADETKAYIEHRLRLVGWAGDPLITDAAHAEIHRLTYGIPRRINSMCDRLLLFGYLEELHELDETTVRKVAEEMQEETSADAARAVPRVAPSQAPAAAGRGAAASPAALDPDLGRRLARVEQSIADLEAALRREQALVRRSILFNTDE